MSLNVRQQAFAFEYALDGNATQAAKRAGYAERAAHSQGYELLKNPEIQAEIARHTQERWAHLALTAERLDREVAKVAFFNLGDAIHVTADGDPLIDLSKLTLEQMAALQGVEIEDFTDGRGEDARQVRRVKIKAHDKIAALTLGMRRLKLLVDKVEVDASEDFAALMEAASRRAAR